MTPSLMEASIIMGYPYERSILKIVFSIIKPSFFVAGILSFVEIAKVQYSSFCPFNFETCQLKFTNTQR